MRRTVFVILAVLLSTASASAPDTLWTRTYGGANDDVGRSMQLTADGGCIIAGYTRSFGAGGNDVWLLKTDAQGDTQWTRTYGGAADDEAYSVDLTFDGGYIVAGMTRSFGAGGSDVWLLKVAATGDTEWSRTWGNTRDDCGRSVRQVADSGYVVGGETYFSQYYGLLLKYDALGDSVWTRWQYAISANCVREAPSGDLIWAGKSVYATDNRLHARTDSLGNGLWGRVSGPGSFSGVALRPDNGSVASGSLYVPARPNPCTYLEIEARDSIGGKSWGVRYRPLPFDAYGSSIERVGNGHVAVGSATSTGDDVYLVRVKLDGDSLWTKVIGGDSEDIGYACQQVADSGFMVVGSTRSFGAGGSDVWLIRLEPEQIGVAEMTKPEVRMTNGGATVLRRLPTGAVAFDAMGRRTASPKPGVYFVREQDSRGQWVEDSRVRKVIVTE